MGLLPTLCVRPLPDLPGVCVLQGCACARGISFVRSNTMGIPLLAKTQLHEKSAIVEMDGIKLLKFSGFPTKVPEII